MLFNYHYLVNTTSLLPSQNRLLEVSVIHDFSTSSIITEKYTTKVANDSYVAKFTACFFLLTPCTWPGWCSTRALAPNTSPMYMSSWSPSDSNPAQTGFSKMWNLLRNAGVCLRTYGQESGWAQGIEETMGFNRTGAAPWTIEHSARNTARAS